MVQARGNGSKITQVQSNVSRPARTLAENEFLVSLGFLTKIIDVKNKNLVMVCNLAFDSYNHT